MARVTNISYVKFKKVSGFTPGPLKPTVTNQDAATTTTGEWIRDKIEVDLASMTKGETVQIIVTVGDEITP